MTHYWESIEAGGWSGSDRTLYVYLYPNTYGDVSATESGGDPADAITAAVDDLYSEGAIGAYGIYRFPAEDSGRSFPDLDINNLYGYQVDDEFRAYLDDEDENGARDDLTDFIGVHQLVHGGSEGCDNWDPDDSSASPGSGAGAADLDTPAFADSTLAWSPVCSYSDLTRNAAVQEMLHGCTTYTYHDDHGLGTIRPERCGQYSTCYRVTPFLTYHWDDYSVPDHNCSKSSSAADSHSQTMTDCTIDAVKDASNQYS